MVLIRTTFASLFLYTMCAGLSAQEKPYTEVEKWAAEVPGGRGPSDFVRIGVYDTYQDAVAATTKWSNDHPDVLDLAREVPIKQRFYPNSTRPQQTQSEPFPPPTRPSDVANVDRNENSLSGKSIKASFGSGELEVDFQRDGTVVFRDPATGKTIAEGTWSQTGRAISIETKGFRYMATIEGSNITGRRVQKGTDGTVVERWDGQTTSRNAPRSSNPAVPKADSDIIGTWVKTDYESARYDFRPDGTVRLIFGGRSDSTGRWSRAGNRVTVDFGTPFVYSLSGGIMDSGPDAAGALRKLQ